MNVMLRGLALAVPIAVSLLLAGAALAHGNPTLRIEPAVVAAGGAVTVVGADMAVGVEFAITLERAGRSVELGRATAKGEEDEGGFTVALTIPPSTTPGSYTIRAASASGKAATADLTVTEGTVAASAPASGTAGMTMASAELHELDRTKTAAELWVFGLGSVALALAGVELVRRAA